MKLNPLQDRLVVRAEKVDTTTPSGIMIISSAAEKPMRGEVLAAGPGCKNKHGDIIRMTVKAGDQVLFSRHTAYSTVELDSGEEVLVMREPDIFAVIKQ